VAAYAFGRGPLALPLPWLNQLTKFGAVLSMPVIPRAGEQKQSFFVVNVLAQHVLCSKQEAQNIHSTASIPLALPVNLCVNCVLRVDSSHNSPCMTSSLCAFSHPAQLSKLARGPLQSPWAASPPALQPPSSTAMPGRQQGQFLQLSCQYLRTCLCWLGTGFMPSV